jgi:hypothetical protein
MSDELKGHNILKLILIVRFACATLDVGRPLFPGPVVDPRDNKRTCSPLFVETMEVCMPYHVK